MSRTLPSLPSRALRPRGTGHRVRILRLLVPMLLAGALPSSIRAQTCDRELIAFIYALDQPIWYNRLGAYDPVGMIFALARDVVPIDGTTGGPGNVKLRDDKRPRPLVLRMNVGDCLTIVLSNLLSPTPRSWSDPNDTSRHQHQPATRAISVHVVGLQPVFGMNDDGSNVGRNASGLRQVGDYERATMVRADREGTYLMYSTGATTGGEGDGGTLARGLFGAINVEPRGSEWYRSQITAEERGWAQAIDTVVTIADSAWMCDPSGENCGWVYDGGQEMWFPRTTPDGQPVMNYDAVYPYGHKFAGLPILKILQNDYEIVHSDLNAIITGPNRGPIPAGTYPTVEVTRDRHEPFREFTVIFHDETGLVQAFPEFDDPFFEHTLHSGRDAFAINYGTGGIGAEILANRFGVGPMKDCNDCKYEEFFLSSWAVGDPAMVVDVPANTRDASNQLITGAKATKVLYPDDPSNVYHSYLNDHVKIRNLHAGPKEHHVFHLHAHQWLHTPDSDNSTYLDSQAIGPGAGFTYEMVYDGSGNRNKTFGDAIFHCHFYPHFAQGMWGLWRVHDVFEAGTELDAEGRPVAGARVLPDGEIAAGTPIPAIVPIPGRPLAPMPGTLGNKGYPLNIPGIAGHRPPRPPLDVARDASGQLEHGGLPRHVVRGGMATFPALNLTDFSKHDVTLDVVELPDSGTVDEKAAMDFHARRTHATYRVDPVTNSVSSGSFVTNGRPPVAGAPFADPCVSDVGAATGNPRMYKGVAFQLDVKYNKAEWHFPQHRMFALWGDYESIKNGEATPQPLFMRTNSNDCITYHLANLVPKEYSLDDFQVRTPTDIIGQHIHLVKFDVTSSDGSANGFNYEDGSLSPGDVLDRIAAIRKFNACKAEGSDRRDGTIECPIPKTHAFFGTPGAMTTISRWFADDVLNAQEQDRTLRTVFTHDHFGPSTHQQAGLYAGLVVEPEGSQWRHPTWHVMLGGRNCGAECGMDGGPTNWAADILTANPDSAYREFNLMVQDFTLAYEKFGSGEGFPNPAKAINPPGRFEPNPVLPDLLRPPVAGACPNGTPAPCPEMISADDPGTMSVNYRNEPIALRVRDPQANAQAAGTAGDLSWALSSSVQRADPRFNVYPQFWPDTLFPGTQAGDPFTPLMRAYEGDRIQMRILVGAHEEGHNFAVHGPRWLFEPAFANSGYRNSQMMGISEHYEFVIPPMPHNGTNAHRDYLYKAGASVDNLWNGTWGLLRAYKRNWTNLLELPNNHTGNEIMVANGGNFNGICPKTATVRTMDVTAVAAASALPSGTLVYNSRTNTGGRLHDPTAILYVRTGDLDAAKQLKPGVPVEPLILRATAGDCIELTLRNALPNPVPDQDGFSTLPMIVDRFNANQVVPSSHVGLHPQLLAFDVSRSDGVNVGTNADQTVAPGHFTTYRWYAGDIRLHTAASASGLDSLSAHPIEFGAVNLTSSDAIQHSNKGAAAALIIEPPGATWVEDSSSRASATVSLPDGSTFREFVLIFQDDINLRNDNGPVPNLAGAEDPEDSGQKGLNYRSEPLWKRMGYAADTPLDSTRKVDFQNVLSNTQVGGDPVTPVFLAEAGTPVRFRVLQGGGHARNHVFNLHGHAWEELPYTANSALIGDNPLSEWKGAQMGHGPTNHFEVVLKFGAGGAFRIPGDYLFRDQSSFLFDGGLWGIMRVLPPETMP